MKMRVSPWTFARLLSGRGVQFGLCRGQLLTLISELKPLIPNGKC
jgi:hypothetical protein